jgi:hypothetical protein
VSLLALTWKLGSLPSEKRDAQSTASSMVYTELASLCYHTVFTLVCTHCLTLVCPQVTTTETQRNDQKELTTTMMRPRIEPDGGGSSHVDDATVRWSSINTAVDTAEDSLASSAACRLYSLVGRKLRLRLTGSSRGGCSGWSGVIAKATSTAGDCERA